MLEDLDRRTIIVSDRQATLFLGKGSPAIEVVEVPFVGQPRITEIRKLFRERVGRRATPVLIVAPWGNARVAVCGPTEHNPVEHLRLPMEQVEAVCQKALAAEGRHTAIRLLHQLLPQLDTPIPGLRNGGLFTMQELEHGVPARGDWALAVQVLPAVQNWTDVAIENGTPWAGERGSAGWWTRGAGEVCRTILYSGVSIEHRRRDDREREAGVLRHYLEQGVPKAAIARHVGVSRETIYRWIATGQLDRDLDGEAVRYRPRAPAPSKLDPYKGIIDTRLADYPRLSAVRLFNEVQAAGYRGGYGQVKRYVRGVRPQEPVEPVRRFETLPGHQGQVDFADFRLHGRMTSCPTGRMMDGH